MNLGAAILVALLGLAVLALGILGAGRVIAKRKKDDEGSDDRT